MTLIIHDITVITRGVIVKRSIVTVITDGVIVKRHDVADKNAIFSSKTSLAILREININLKKCTQTSIFHGDKAENRRTEDD